MHVIKLTTLQLQWLHSRLKQDQDTVLANVASFLQSARDAAVAPGWTDKETEKELEAALLGPDWKAAWRQRREQRSMVELLLKELQGEMRSEERADREARQRALRIVGKG